MEFKSFVSGIFFLVGLQMLLPLLGVRIDVALPYAPVSTVAAAALALLISYYLFKSS